MKTKTLPLRITMSSWAGFSLGRKLTDALKTRNCDKIYMKLLEWNAHCDKLGWIAKSDIHIRHKNFQLFPNKPHGNLGNLSFLINVAVFPESQMSWEVNAFWNFKDKFPLYITVKYARKTF